jgi:hypothetical protein
VVNGYVDLMLNLKHTLIRGVGGAATGASVLNAIASVAALSVSATSLALIGAVLALVGLMATGELIDRESEPAAAE